MDGLTDDGQRFIGHLKINPVLDRLAEPHWKRPVGRPPAERPDAKAGQLNLLPDY
jgi:hypothetical protein